MRNLIYLHVRQTKVGISQPPPVVESANSGTSKALELFIALLSNPHRLIGFLLTISLQ
jgi:hypothetical protein